MSSVIIFNDDDFSHLVFFVGFTVINLVILLTQVLFPSRSRMTATDIVLVVVNALFIGAGIFANLAFEQIGLDLYVVAIIAVVAGALLYRRPGQPILLYYTVAYLLGLVATTIAKIA